jgi:hypothetical protein
MLMASASRTFAWLGSVSARKHSMNVPAPSFER